MDKEQLRRQKISATMKGRMPANLALLHSLPRTEEWKRNIGAGRKGKMHTEATKLLISQKKMGQLHTDETKKKISQNHSRHNLGKSNPRFGQMNKGKFGKDHPHWVENKKSSLQKSIRSAHKYHQYKAAVLRRDNFACVLCGSRGVYLELDHHPKGFAELLKEHNILSLDQALLCKELWSLENGRTICQPCHETTDNFPRQLKGKRKYHATS